MDPALLHAGMPPGVKQTLGSQSAVRALVSKYAPWPPRCARVVIAAHLFFFLVSYSLCTCGRACASPRRVMRDTTSSAFVNRIVDWIALH